MKAPKRSRRGDNNVEVRAKVDQATLTVREESNRQNNEDSSNRRTRRTLLSLPPQASDGNKTRTGTPLCRMFTFHFGTAIVIKGVLHMISRKNKLSHRRKQRQSDAAVNRRNGAPRPPKGRPRAWLWFAPFI